MQSRGLQRKKAYMNRCTSSFVRSKLNVDVVFVSVVVSLFVRLVPLLIDRRHKCSYHGNARCPTIYECVCLCVIRRMLRYLRRKKASCVESHRNDFKVGLNRAAASVLRRTSCTHYFHFHFGVFDCQHHKENNKSGKREDEEKKTTKSNARSPKTTKTYKITND